MAEMEDDRITVESVQVPGTLRADAESFDVVINAHLNTTVGAMWWQTDGCEGVVETAGWHVRATVHVTDLVSGDDESYTATQQFCVNTTDTVGHAINLPVPALGGEFLVTTNLEYVDSGRFIGSVQNEMYAPGDDNGGNGGQNENLELKDGYITFEDVLLPTKKVRPGTNIEIGVQATNHAGISTGDPDACSASDTPCSTQDGYCVQAMSTLGGGQTERLTYCLHLPFSGLGSNTQTDKMTVAVPSEEGTYTLSTELQTSATGENTSPLETAIEVSQSATPPDTGSTYRLDLDGGGGGIGSGIDIEKLVKLGVIGVGFWALAQAADAADGLTEPEVTDGQ